MREKKIDPEEMAKIRCLDCDAWGNDIRYWIVDRGKELRIKRALAAQGREELGEFMGWLMFELGFAESSARAIVGRVWACLYETGNQVSEKLEDFDLSWTYRQKLHTDLRKYVAFLLHATDLDDEDRSVGEYIAEQLADSEFWEGRPQSAITDRYRPRRRRRRR